MQTGSGANLWLSWRSVEESIPPGQWRAVAIRKISKYFPDSPPEEHISCHSLSARDHHHFEPWTGITWGSRLASCIDQQVKSVCDFDVVVSQNGLRTVNIEDATLEGLKEYIQKMEKPPALESIKVNKKWERYSPWNLGTIKTSAKCSVSKKNFKFTCLSRRHQNHLMSGPFRKCVNSMSLAMIRIPTLTCTLFFMWFSWPK